MKIAESICLITVFSSQLLINGCQKEPDKPKMIDVTLINVSTNSLDWVTLDWSGPYMPGGIIGVGISKTAIDLEWPTIPSAKLTFVDEKTRKPYSIDVSFEEINKSIKSNNCHEVKIRILSYAKAEVICGKK